MGKAAVRMHNVAINDYNEWDRLLLAEALVPQYS